MSTTTITKKNSLALDGLDRAAAAYLALPLFLFFWGWFSPIAAATLAIVLFYFLTPLLKRPDGEAQGRLPAAWILGAVALATLWAAFGGAGHWLSANHFDWKVRDAVLRDLVVQSWPVGYRDAASGVEYWLRAPISYFLPAAALAKLSGLASADLWLYAWTVAGLGLFIALTLSHFPRSELRWLWLLLLPLASGMDAIGWLFFNGAGFPLGQHLEWWASLYQYSSNSTLLFWVPNHALPGWLAAGLIVRHWDEQHTAPWIFLLTITATLLWSPLVTISVAVVGLAWLACQSRGAAGLRFMHERRLWLLAMAALVLSATMAAWLTADSAAVGSGSTFDSMMFSAQAQRWIAFQILEWGVLAALVMRRDSGAPFWIAVLILLVLPAFRLGPNNDLAMRASIVPLTIVFMQVPRLLVDSKSAGRVLVALLVLAIGAVTPFQEFWRAWTGPRWQPDLTRSLPAAAEAFPPHYTARQQRMPAALRPWLATSAVPNSSVEGLAERAP